MERILSIAIFNGLPYHYEMFGYIIHWCQIHGYNCTIYTGNQSNHGWLAWYQKQYSFPIYKPIDQFVKNSHLHQIIFLTTADDKEFKSKWLPFYGLSQKVVRIPHNSTERAMVSKDYLNVRPIGNDEKYAFPVHPILSSSQKSSLVDRNRINIFISARNYVYDTRSLQILNDIPEVSLHFIGRSIAKGFRFLYNSKNVIHEGISTEDMINLASMCQYMFFG
jgi:hypothetical protein